MRRPTPAHRACPGFTLVEVLVALFAMALLAAMAWRGLDGIMRSRDISRAAVDRTMRLTTVLTQWEQDLQALQAEGSVPPLSFDGRTLRVVRRGANGLQLVAWSLEGTTWLRWVSAPVTRVPELREAWLRSQQLQSAEPAPLKLLEQVDDWQVYCYRGNAWSNCQSSGDLEAPGAAQAAASAASGATATQPLREQLPSGVRLQLQWEGATVTRDIALAPQQ